MLVLTVHWWPAPVSVGELLVYLGFNVIFEWFVWQPRFTINDYRERLYAEIVHRKKELRRKHREKERLEHELLSRGSSQRQSRYRSSTSEQHLHYIFLPFHLVEHSKCQMDMNQRKNDTWQSLRGGATPFMLFIVMYTICEGPKLDV